MLRRIGLVLVLSAAACGGSAATNPPVEIPSSGAAPAASATSAGSAATPAPGAPKASPGKPPRGNVDKDGLEATDLVVGTGREAKVGSRIAVDYTGTLEDGTEFDSSRKPGRKPIQITLGIGQVIKGWDRGVEGMREGGKRRLVIPYPLAYGEDGKPPKIPPKATLIFEVELVEVKDK
jgi:peptidylprolyl isomerase